MSALQGQLSLSTGLSIWEGFELVLPDQTIRFHAGTNENRGSVIWQGNVYTPWPIQAQEFATPSQGSPARPKLQVGNFGGTISALCRQYDDLLVAKLKRRRTLVKYMDAVNFVQSNYLLWSEEATQTVWTKAGVTASLPALFDPYGSQVSQLVEGLTTSHYIRQVGTAFPAEWYTASAVVKLCDADRPQVRIRLADSVGFRSDAFMDLSTGQLLSTVSPDRGVVNLGGGSYLIWCSGLLDPAATSFDFRVLSRDASGSETYTGNGTSGFYVSSMQLTRSRGLLAYQKTGASWNPTANPTEEYPVETWIITRKASETPAAIEFELGSPLDLQGVKLPRRQVIAGTCLWAYRSGECGYAGGPVADYANRPTSDPALDQCSRSVTGCKLRFGEFGELPFGGFPGIARVPRL
ncbi:phage minor tail protein L [Pseudomonas moorei]|uniref:Lambda-like phage minor tail protein L n=1 Tax=Pseudomonas moorei TaxID=395599 RepID=A0A1H1FGV2_9PSED|nr:phage minor tail protein L [Pseudomonas moorei]SDR00343.1 lambda-like phage minor tail protein L [Pseudomonas moorei]